MGIKIIFRLFLVAILSTAAVFVSCTDEEPVGPPGGGGGGDDTFDVPDKTGMNIKGIVFCGKEPLAGVVVSDGFEVTTTDADGCYWLPSDKRSGYVFISVPGGYMPLLVSGTNIPAFFERLTKGVAQVERHDFELYTAANDNHTAVLAADFHLANRTNDKSQLLATFVKELKALAAERYLQGRPLYVITLGDLTWDSYWDRGYELPDFVADRDMHSIVQDGRRVPFFNSMGNHDNDPSKTGSTADWDGEGKFRGQVGPVWYSFNLGKIHYVVVDNIEYVNRNNSHDYNRRIADYQIAWLKKDLATLAKTTPIVVVSHSQMVVATGVTNRPATGNAVYSITQGVGTDNFNAFMSCFDGFSKVDIFTGHSHRDFNINYTEYPNITEHNIPSVCATWWWTGNHLGNGVQVCIDGSPGGYGILSAGTGGVEYSFKGHGMPLDKQFRSYDRNEIIISNVKYATAERPHLIGKNLAYYSAPYDVDIYNNGVSSDDNEILVNVWNFGPGWSVEMTEGSKSLTVAPKMAKDPYHIVTYELQRMAAGASTEPTSTFVTPTTHHMFSAKASSRTSTVVIKVTDDNGNVYTETMARPKRFPVSQQEIKDYYLK